MSAPESVMESWEATHPHVRPVFTPAALLRIKRALRRAPPQVMDSFTLFENLHRTALGAPLPEGGFYQGFRAALKVLARSLPRIVGSAALNDTTQVIIDLMGSIGPGLKRIDAGNDTAMVYTQVSAILANGLSVVLGAAGLSFAPVTIPGGIRFFGLKPSTLDTELSPVPQELASVFTADEASLPKAAQQPSSDLEEMYDQARVAGEHQLDLLNRGKGLDRAIGAKVVLPGDPVDLSEPGPLVMIGPLKGRKRVEEKAAADGASYDSILDLVRATIAVDSIEEIPKVMRTLRDMGMVVARQPKNRFVKPTDVGYRDLMFNVRYPNGHVGELQINLKPMLIAKKMGHKLYETTRSIEALKVVEGNRNLTPDEQQEVDFANQAQRALYDEAWRHATQMAPGPGAGRTASSNRTKYYDYGGHPAKVVRLNLPVFLNKIGDEVVVYDSQKFAREASPISESQYNRMVAEIFQPRVPRNG